MIETGYRANAGDQRRDLWRFGLRYALPFALSIGVSFNAVWSREDATVTIALPEAAGMTVAIIVILLIARALGFQTRAESAEARAGRVVA